MALVVAFDLEFEPALLDITVFVNSILGEVVYCGFPEVFEESGYCLPATKRRPLWITTA